MDKPFDEIGKEEIPESPRLRPSWQGFGIAVLAAIAFATCVAYFLRILD